MAEIIKNVNYFDDNIEENVVFDTLPVGKIEFKDSDILQLEIHVGEILIDTMALPAVEFVNFKDGNILIDYFDILSNRGAGYTSGTYRIITSILRNPIYPNKEVRVDEISRNKTEIRLDAWVDDDALINIRKPLPYATPKWAKEYAIKEWDLEEHEADQCYVYAKKNILDKPNSNWYSIAKIDAAKNERTIEIQSLHESNWQHTDTRGSYNNIKKPIGYKTLRLLHGKVGLIRLINWDVDTNFEESAIIVKAAGKFPREIKTGDNVLLYDDIIDPIELNVSIDLVEQTYLEDSNKLAGPDWTINVNREVGKPTDLNSWDDILSSTDSVTNNEVINKIFSGSASTELNIDYSDFANFIHFSSAEERLENFKYKLQLVEEYEASKSAFTGDSTGSLSHTTESTALGLKIDKIIGTFDGYEQKIYYSSASEYTDTYGTHWNYTWPKADSTKPYTQLSSSHADAITWFADAIARAQDYDDQNLNALRNLIPLHIKLDSQNNGYVLFVDLIAEHFDRIYNYIDHLTMFHNKEENSRVGLSKDLLFEVLKSFGWKPESGLDLAELWEYHLGKNSSGTYTHETSSAEYPAGGTVINSVTGTKISIKDLETEPWSRILNNLPYLLKTKGTKRGIQALISCYGIPQSILKVQEFGGPDPSNAVSGSNNKEITQPSYAVKFDGANTYMTSSWLEDTQTVEFRFRTTESANKMVFIGNTTGSLQGWAISAIPTSGKKGKISFQIYDSTNSVGILTDELPIYDDDWWSVFLSLDLDTSQDFTLTCQKVPDHSTGTVTHTSAVTYQYSPFAGPLPFGWRASEFPTLLLARGKVSGGLPLASNQDYTGSMQEVRLWDTELVSYVKDIHTRAPISILGNSYSSSYDNLLFRLPLGADTQKPDFTTLDTISSRHPNQTTARTAKMFGTSSFSSQFMEEDYFTPVPNSIGIRSVDNKIRIEDNDNVGPLHPFETREVASGDYNPIDSNLLFVGFSPQDELDTDIALQFGGMSIDDIVGDPRDNYKSYYTDLRKFSDAYFKKYDQSMNIWAFMRIIKYFNTALFKQIESMLPARGNNIVGLMIKPSLLERPKIVTHPQPSWIDLYHTSSIDIYAKEKLISADDLDSSVTARSDTDTTNYQWSSIIQDAGIDTSVANRTTQDFTIQTGSFWFTGSYQESEVMTYVSSSRLSWCTIYEVANRNTAGVWDRVDVQPNIETTGMYNLSIAGCKMTSEDWNIDSPDTVDGGPVVEIHETNPNKLIADEASWDGDISIV